MENFIKKYKTFFENNIINDKLPLPGEHHFVGICLTPLLYIKDMKNFEKIEYLNPDGAKVSIKKKSTQKKNKNFHNLYDLTFRNEKNQLVGIEVKYSKNMSLKFSYTQLNQFLSQKGKSFLGVLALVYSKIDKCSRVIYISGNDFIKQYEIKKLSNNNLKTHKYKSFKVDLSDESSWRELKTDKDFLDNLNINDNI